MWHCAAVCCYVLLLSGASQSESRESAAAVVDAGAAHGLVSSKRVQCDWSVNLGEHVVDIMVARYSRSLAASQIDILIVGEHTLFTLKEQGSIRLQKRLDFNPSAAMPYNVTDDGERSNAEISALQQQPRRMLAYPQLHYQLIALQLFAAFKLTSSLLNYLFVCTLLLCCGICW